MIIFQSKLQFAVKINANSKPTFGLDEWLAFMSPRRDKWASPLQKSVVQRHFVAFIPSMSIWMHRSPPEYISYTQPFVTAFLPADKIDRLHSGKAKKCCLVKHDSKVQDLF